MTTKRKYSVSTEQNKRRSSRNHIFSVFAHFLLWAAFILITTVPKPSFSALVDKTAAVVGDKILTYREIEIRYITGQVIDGYDPKIFGGELSESSFNVARNKAIRDLLVQNYLERIALKTSVDPKEIDREADALSKYFKTADQYNKFLKFYEIDNEEIRDIIGYKLTGDDFFKKSMVFSSAVSDKEALEYYENEKAKKFYGKSFGDLKANIKKYLQKQKIQRSTEEWIKEQLKRVKVRLIG